VIYVTEVKHKSITYSRYFIHTGNIVAEYKLTNITYNWWCQKRGLKTITSTQLYTVYETACKYSVTQKREHLKNPTKIEEIQKKKLLTEIEPLQVAF